MSMGSKLEVLTILLNYFDLLCLSSTRKTKKNSSKILPPVGTDPKSLPLQPSMLLSELILHLLISLRHLDIHMVMLYHGILSC